MSIAADFPASLDVDLSGLSDAAAPWLAGLPVSDQRIQAVPDGRTLRFYQSTGLLDRPLRYDGRAARYGRRHLLQLLAVRALQSQGHSLAQIQTSLAGATDPELAQELKTALARGAPSITASPAPVPPHGPAVSAGPVAPIAPPAFVAAELAPGVVITIDSRIHTDTARLIESLRRALPGADT